MKQITLDEWEIDFGAANLLKKIYLSDYNKSTLESYQLEALRDLEGFVSHIPNTLGPLFDRNNILWDKVMKRDSFKCRPRITLFAHITRRHNLALSWRPTGEVYRARGINDTDFEESMSGSYNHTGYFGRPECELLFIHNIRALNYDISENTPDSNVSALLIGASCAAMKSFRNFLMKSFEVTTEYWFKLTFDKGTISKFGIVDVTEREAKQEKEWFHGFRRQYGIEPGEFITLFKNEPTSGKVSKILKGKGINIYWREVRRVAERLKSLHSDAWSEGSAQQDNPLAKEN